MPPDLFRINANPSGCTHHHPKHLTISLSHSILARSEIPAYTTFRVYYPQSSSKCPDIVLRVLTTDRERVDSGCGNDIDRNQKLLVCSVDICGRRGNVMHGEICGQSDCYLSTVGSGRFDFHTSVRSYQFLPCSTPVQTRILKVLE